MSDKEYTKRFAVGDKVRVDSARMVLGPFLGIIYKVDRVNGDYYVVVLDNLKAEVRKGESYIMFEQHLSHYDKPITI